MSERTVRANAQALPEATKPTPAAPASPEATPHDEYLRLQAAKIVADVRLEAAIEKRKEEANAAAAAAAEAEEDKRWQARQAFTQAHNAWLMAKASLDGHSLEDEEMDQRLTEDRDAERRLMTTPAAYPDQLWTKLEGFELILGHELTTGLRTNSILMLALGSIKQDIVNMDLCV
jgi:hypothetical protein